MPRAWCLSPDTVGSSMSGGATVYMTLACTDNAGWSTAESPHQLTYQKAGTLTHVNIRVLTNNRGASTLTIRKNSSNALSLSIGASLTGNFAEEAGAVSVAVGDIVNYALTVGTSGTTFTIGSLSALFDAPLETALYEALHSSGVALATSDSTTYACIAGRMVGLANSTESQEQVRCREAGTLSHLTVRVTGNTRTTDTTVRLRINGANGAMSVTIAGGATGEFIHATTTDQVAVDDLLNYAITTGSGSGSITISLIACLFTSSSGKHPLVIGQSGGSATVSAGLTRNFFLAGDVNAVTTETNSQARPLSFVALSDFVANISANTINTGTTTIRPRSSGANLGSAVVNIPAGSTGFLSDTTNSGSDLRTSALNYQMVVSGSSGSLSLRNLSCVCRVHLDVAHRGVTASGSDATSLSLSLAPRANRLYLVTVHNTKATTPDTPTVSGTNGWNVTWTQIGTLTYNTSGSPQSRLTLFWGVAASNISGVITASTGAITQTGWLLAADEVMGANTTTPIRAGSVATAFVNGGSSATITLGAFAHVFHAGFCSGGRNDNLAFTPSGAYIELFDTGHMAPTTRALSSWRVNDVNAGVSVGASGNLGAVACELQIEPLSATGAVKLLGGRLMRAVLVRGGLVG